MGSMSAPAVIEVDAAEWEAHRKRVEVCVGMLNALIAGLSQNPMFAGFIPPDVRRQIAEVAEL